MKIRFQNRFEYHVVFLRIHSTVEETILELNFYSQPLSADTYESFPKHKIKDFVDFIGAF